MPVGQDILDKSMPTSVSSLIFLQYLTSVFDNIDEVIVLFGIEPKGRFRVLLTNSAFNRVTGWDEDVTGRLAHEVLTPEALAALKQHGKKVVETKRKVEFSGWFDLAGGYHAFEIKLIPVLNTVGECVQVAAIAHKVTELYKLREENTRLRNELKQLKGLAG